MDTVKTCACGRTFTEEDSYGRTCFKCKLGTVGFNFVGVAGRGRKAFNEHTVSSYLAEADHNITASGGDVNDYEHVGGVHF